MTTTALPVALVGDTLPVPCADGMERPCLPFDAGRGPVAAWLVSDERSELRAELRVLAARHGVQPAAAATALADLMIEPHPVVHTSHPAWGYLLRLPAATVVWAPEFWQFPAWAAGADLMFADAAGWNRPIRFARGAGGHMAALDVAGQARQHQVKRLVFAHIGRPSLRAIDAGYRLPFGEWGMPGRTYRVPARPAQASARCPAAVPER